MRLAWMTDIHLNFVHSASVKALVSETRAAHPDAVLIGGDIGAADSACLLLEDLAAQLDLPVFFVLGNHDFYHGSIAAVRAEAAELSKRLPRLTWLTATGVIALTTRTALVGHDGWGDGGFGNVTTTPVLLNDFVLIEELRNSGGELPAVLRKLGEEAASHFRTVLPEALRTHEHIIALTHVPPFREACWHEGRLSDDDWLPYFACRAAGAELRRQMSANPHRSLTTLCGHTHGSGECRVLPNLTVLTGGAEYGRPRLQRIIEVP
jgi:predicted phosphohydrolase